MSRKRVAVLISGRGSNMAALIEAAKDKDLPGRDRAGAFRTGRTPAGLPPRARPASPPKSIDHTPFGKDRAAFERALQAMLDKHRIDLVCLAGFMRLLTPGFVGQWPQRMLNIHPSLLPAFKGLDTHKRALEAGAKCMAPPCISSCRKWTQARSSCRPQLQCERTTTRRRWPRAC